MAGAQQFKGGQQFTLARIADVELHSVGQPGVKPDLERSNRHGLGGRWLTQHESLGGAHAHGWHVGSTGL